MFPARTFMRPNREDKITTSTVMSIRKTLEGVHVKVSSHAANWFGIASVDPLSTSSLPAKLRV